MHQLWAVQHKLQNLGNWDCMTCHHVLGVVKISLFLPCWWAYYQGFLILFRSGHLSETCKVTWYLPFLSGEIKVFFYRKFVFMFWWNKSILFLKLIFQVMHVMQYKVAKIGQLKLHEDLLTVYSFKKKNKKIQMQFKLPMQSSIVSMPRSSHPWGLLLSLYSSTSTSNWSRSRHFKDLA